MKRFFTFPYFVYFKLLVLTGDHLPPTTDGEDPSHVVKLGEREAVIRLNEGHLVIHTRNLTKEGSRLKVKIDTRINLTPTFKVELATNGGIVILINLPSPTLAKGIVEGGTHQLTPPLAPKVLLNLLLNLTPSREVLIKVALAIDRDISGDIVDVTLLRLGDNLDSGVVGVGSPITLDILLKVLVKGIPSHIVIEGFGTRDAIPLELTLISLELDTLDDLGLDGEVLELDDAVGDFASLAHCITFFRLPHWRTWFLI